MSITKLDVLGLVLLLVGCVTVVYATSILSTFAAVLLAGLLAAGAGAIALWISAGVPPAEPVEPKGDES